MGLNRESPFHGNPTTPGPRSTPNAHRGERREGFWVFSPKNQNTLFPAHGLTHTTGNLDPLKFFLSMTLLTPPEGELLQPLKMSGIIAIIDTKFPRLTPPPNPHILPEP